MMLLESIPRPEKSKEKDKHEITGPQDLKGLI